MELQALFNDDDDDDEEAQRTRPPVITVMGHVDHGKTTLLDKIRSANVVAGEAGGITQHIGAYKVERDGHEITFIDTPGHAAFTKMRARGAQVTDIVVLMVAADDGVMPQTVEAINHANAAEVPIVVAVNKIDKENADPQRVLTQLAEQGLVPESWGGDTITVEMSAQQNLGVDDLLDQLLVVAELEELTANPTGRAKGVVLEANLDVGRGPVATILVDKGLLKTGDPIVAGAAWGKVRAMLDDKGNQIKEAGPSTPVQVLGLSSVPNAGDEFRAAPDEKTARTVAEAREQRARVKNQRADARVQKGVKLEDIFTQIQKGEVATLNLVLKADVQGSLEALTESLRKLEREDVRPVFVHRAVGGITENDITLAATTNATIIGFNVRPDRKARELAEAENVEIRTYEIIYQIIEDIERAMVGLLAPEYEEVVTGEAEVREIFRVPRVGAIAGCYVRSGVITRGTKVRFLRDGVIIWKGSITSLKRFKDDVREVREGFECGIGLSDFQDLKQGDLIETYEDREIART
jgi:translation initiation factor IF-2